MKREIDIVVRIPEEALQAIKEGTFDKEYTPIELLGYIQNGIPLPKGHGRLIDTDTIAGDGSWDWSDRLDATPTIIEADIPTMYYPQVEGITPTIIEADKETNNDYS